MGNLREVFSNLKVAVETLSNAVEEFESSISIAPLPTIAPGSTFALHGRRFKFGGWNFLPADVTLIGPGHLICADDNSLLRFGLRNKAYDVTFVGTLSSAPQLVLVRNGFVNGQYVPLSLNKRYAIYINDGFAGPIEFWRTNANGSDIDRWSAVRGWSGTWLALTGANGLKAKGAGDLSKVNLYELSSDYAAMPLDVPHEVLTNVSSYSDGVELTNCIFQSMKFAAYKIVQAKGCKVTGGKVWNSLGGITAQDGANNSVTDVLIDLRLRDNLSNLVPSGIATRNHGIAIGNGEFDFAALRNTILGTSWAIEHPEMDVVGSRTLANDNVIDAVHCGISNCSNYGQNHRNKIRLSAIGFAGIELPTANYSKTTWNDIYQTRSAWDSYGIAGSHGLSNAEILDNRIRADTGIQMTPAGVGMKIARNNIEFFSRAFSDNLLSFAPQNSSRKI